MKIGDKGSIEIIKFEEPLVLKGYDAKLVDIPKYSDIYNENGPISIEFFDKLTFSVITGSGGIISCDVESALTLKSLEGRLYKSAVIFNNIVLTRRMGFIFSYRIKDKEKNVIFDKYDFITGYTPFGFNMFTEMSEESFGSFLKSKGYHDFYDDYALLKIQENLQANLVLSKSTMTNKINEQNRQQKS